MGEDKEEELSFSADMASSLQSLAQVVDSAKKERRGDNPVALMETVEGDRIVTPPLPSL